MEEMEGDLAVYWRTCQKKLDLANRFNIGCQMLATCGTCLEYLHSINHLHRDIKLENYLFRMIPNPIKGELDIEIKLADFGSLHVRQTDRSFSYSGHLCGTSGHLAPEVVVASNAWNEKIHDYKKRDEFRLLCKELEPVKIMHEASRLARREYGGPKYPYSTASDVFSFGVLMARVIYPKGLNENLEHFTSFRIEKELIDSNEYILYEAPVTICKLCFVEDPKLRPSMEQIVERINALKDKM
jgi:serine/threonine protein kinase